MIVSDLEFYRYIRHHESLIFYQMDYDVLLDVNHI